MEIEVESIVIDKNREFGWNVTVGDRYADQLGYDECLGLVATLIVNNSPKNCLGWLKTKEQHEAWLQGISKNSKDSEETIKLIENT